MIIYNTRTYNRASRQYNIIVDIDTSKYGIVFDSVNSQDEELIKYISLILCLKFYYPFYMRICVEVATQIGILDKVKSILVFTKYKDLL